MRILSIAIVAALAGLGLAGCASNHSQTSKTLGLTSGPLPQPQSFVVDSRPGRSEVYPIVGTTPPARSDTVLPMNQRKALEASLMATPGRQATPSAPPSKNKKKREAARSAAGAQAPK